MMYLGIGWIYHRIRPKSVDMSWADIYNILESNSADALLMQADGYIDA